MTSFSWYVKTCCQIAHYFYYCYKDNFIRAWFNSTANKSLAGTFSISFLLLYRLTECLSRLALLSVDQKKKRTLQFHPKLIFFFINSSDSFCNYLILNDYKNPTQKIKVVNFQWVIFLRTVISKKLSELLFYQMRQKIIIANKKIFFGYDDFEVYRLNKRSRVNNAG